MYAFDVLEFWVAFVHSMVKQFTKSKKSNNTKTIFSKTIPYYKRKHQKGVQKNYIMHFCIIKIANIEQKTVEY